MTTEEPTETEKHELPTQVVTCVYCGHEYASGTPTHKAEQLTDHIKICEKHPMREAEAKISRLKSALVGLVGAESKDELRNMFSALENMPVPAEDKTAMLNAINTLIEL